MIIKMYFFVLTIFCGAAMSQTLQLADFFQISKDKLTKITWEHAVNSKAKLEAALKSNIQMLEADVQFGNLNDNSESNISIMAHPPNKISDLSLNQFLNNISDFNDKNNKNKKGVKLDFKSIEAFTASIPILRKYIEQINFPLWLNADIIKGPGSSNTNPVDAVKFLTLSKEFKNSTLSIGWTTNYNENDLNTAYTQENIVSMLNTVENNGVNQSITFPVRAVYAAESHQQMDYLLSNVTGSTLTIWSAENDKVNATQLRQMILDIGMDKIYIDVPKQLLDDLNLNNSARPTIGLLSFVLATLLVMFNTF